MARYREHDQREGELGLWVHPITKRFTRSPNGWHGYARLVLSSASSFYRAYEDGDARGYVSYASVYTT